MQSTTLRKRTISAIAAGMLFASGAAIAQTADAPAEAQTVEIAPVSDAEVSQFIEANRKVVEVANAMTLEIEQAPDPEAASTIQAQAEERMVAQIEAEGLTANRYTEIALLAQSDPAFLAKLQTAASGG